jgi:flagellin-like protein
MLSHSPGSDQAASPVIAIVLLIGITFILAMLVLLMCLGFQIPHGDPSVPAIFVISKIQHVNPHGVLDYDSYMIVTNSGKIPYDNRKLYAKTFRNGALLPCIIPTLNGHDFIPLHPYGIQTLGGLGSHNYYWYPGQTINIDYSKGTFHPADIVRFEVYDRRTNIIISRDTWPHITGRDTPWFYNYFL